MELNPKFLYKYVTRLGSSTILSPPADWQILALVTYDIVLKV